MSLRRMNMAPHRLALRRLLRPEPAGLQIEVRTLPQRTVAGITGYKRLPSNDYGALMHAVATVGPIAISVDASWDLYEEVPLRPKVRT